MIARRMEGHDLREALRMGLSSASADMLRRSLGASRFGNFFWQTIWN